MNFSHPYNTVMSPVQINNTNEKKFFQRSSHLSALNESASINLNQTKPFQKWILPEQNKTRINSHEHGHNHNKIDSNDENNYRLQEVDNEPDEEHKRLSYCYLCSVDGHVHKKTEPVPMHKRRYLRPYINPKQLMKKYEIFETDEELRTKFRFSIKTGPGQHSGTDSNVFIELIGTAGSWNKTELKSPNLNKDIKFPANSLVEIDIDGYIIGDLKKLRISHTAKSIKDGWFLEYVEVTCFRLKQTWKFVCNRWLSEHRPPDYKNSTVLFSQDNLALEKLQNSVEYVLLLKTSDRPLPASEVNVQFQFVGSKGQSIIFNLLSPYVNLFETHQLDAFLFTSTTDLGKPEKLRMAIENQGKKLLNEWNIQEMKVIYSKEPNKLYTFKLEKWVDKNQKLNAAISPGSVISIDSANKNEKGKLVYHITTLTGSAKFAGTDARVFIEIAGTLGHTSVHQLHNSKAKKEFERNQTNHFHIFDINVGQIKEIRIFHDNTGIAPGWLLDTVLIRPMSTTITGKSERHDAELKEQLDKLIKKIKIREMKSSSSSQKTVKSVKRSTSADFSKLSKNNRSGSVESNDSKSPSRSSVKESKSIASKKRLDRSTSSMDISRASPTSSILKTSASPRTASENLRKQVKFDSKEVHHQGDATKAKIDQPAKPDAPKIEMKLNWIISMRYNQANEVENIKTIENFDKSLKNIDEKQLHAYDSNLKKQNLASKVAEVEEERKHRAENFDNFIHVFECKKWLAKDLDDRKIERILRVTNVLDAK